MALQIPGIPGVAELIMLLLILAIIGIAVGMWVYRDASARGSAWAWQWGVGIAILFVVGLVAGLIGLAVYLIVRKDKTPTR